MRELKFRVRFNGEYYHGSNYTLFNLYWKYVDDEKNPAIFEQYTGLHDKDGKEIYDGDVVKWLTRVYEVYYDEDRAGFSPFANDNGCGCCGEAISSDSCRIIGNIHQNPELEDECR